MRLNNKHTAEDLESYIQMYLKDGISFKELSETFGLFLWSKGADGSTP